MHIENHYHIDSSLNPVVELTFSNLPLEGDMNFKTVSEENNILNTRLVELSNITRLNTEELFEVLKFQNKNLGESINLLFKTIKKSLARSDDSLSISEMFYIQLILNAYQRRRELERALSHKSPRSRLYCTIVCP